MTTRKDFLVTGAIAASLVACSSTNGSSQRAAQYDEAGFNKIVSKSASHRHCFGISGIDGGEGLYAMNNLLGTYQHSLNVPLDQVNLIGVLYRVEPVAVAFNDDVWNSVIIPALPKMSAALRSNFESVRVTSGNPFRFRPAGANGEDASVESLVARGANFFVCSNATMKLALQLGNATREDPQAIYQRFTAGLVDGASFVPTGVWALHALQENHFTYVQATV